jgi:hypothetical protein
MHDHRLLLNYEARFDRMSPTRLLNERVAKLEGTGPDLAADVEGQRA